MPGVTKNIWVVAEHSDGSIQPATYEVLSFADKVRRAVGGKISVVVLAHPARPMAGQVAERTGFANGSYFSQVFKKRIGCPPSRYYETHVAP